jgi:hypothetical protein
MNAALPAVLLLTAVLERTAGVTLRAAVKELPADGTSVARIKISVHNANGLPAPDETQVILRATLGDLPESVRTRGGEAVVDFRAGTIAGDATIEANALEQWDQLTLRLIPGAPAALALRGDRRSLLCDGADSTELHVAIRDAHGNRLEKVPVQLAVEGGRAPAGQIDGSSWWDGKDLIARYRAPAACASSAVMVTAQSEGVRASWTLRLAPPPTRSGLGLRMNGQWNLGRLLAPTAELEGDMRPTDAFETMQATASVELLASSFTVPVASQSQGPYQLVVRPLAVSAYLGPRFRLYRIDQLSVYVGGGLDGHYARVRSWSSQGSVAQVEQGFALGVHARVGAALELGPGSLNVQVRYVYANLDSLRSFHGQIGGVGLGVGYRFGF